MEKIRRRKEEEEVKKSKQRGERRESQTVLRFARACR